MIRGIALTLIVLIAGGSAACADEVWVDKLRYAGVQVAGVERGRLVFLLHGRRVLKPLADVTRIQLTAHPAVTKAEGLLEAGQLDEAIAAYRAAAQAGGAAWVKTLIRHRRLLAEDRKAHPAPAPTTKPAPAPATRCYWCGGTGWMACPACRAGNVNTGEAKCPECNATGFVTCPLCEGQCCQRKCRRCGGEGTTVVRTVRSGALVRKVYGPCPDCGGTGYEDPCARCCTGEKKHYGKVTCFACKGTGRYGPCARCKGNKKVPCIHCDAGKKRAAEFAGIAATQPTDPKIFRTLSAPKAFVKNWPRQPDYEKMTTLQWALAAKQYGERTAAIRKKLLGREVRWQLRVADVKPVKDSDDFDLLGVSAGGIKVHVIFKRNHLETLANLRKNQQITAVGKVALWPPDKDTDPAKHTPSLVSPDGQVRLEGKAVEAPVLD